MFNQDYNQVYVTRLVAEHRRLHRMLVLACRNLAADDPAWPANFERVLSDIRAELQAHFCEEEQGGCLDEAVSFHPALAPKLKHLEEEHPRLLAALDRLRAQANDARNSVQDRVQLCAAFEELCRDIHAHESAETDVLRHGFEVDIEPEPNGLTEHAADA